MEFPEPEGCCCTFIDSSVSKGCYMCGGIKKNVLFHNESILS